MSNLGPTPRVRYLGRYLQRGRSADETRNPFEIMVPQEGFEPPTRALRMRCSTPELLRRICDRALACRRERQRAGIALDGRTLAVCPSTGNPQAGGRAAQKGGCVTSDSRAALAWRRLYAQVLHARASLFRYARASPLLNR